MIRAPALLSRSPRLRDAAIIVIVGALLFIPFLGTVHLFDWDEVNFAECAREMIVSGNWLRVQVNFEPFWEKPPLFIWLQALSMKTFGINEFAARFVNAVCGIVTLLVVYRIGTVLLDPALGRLWVMAFLGSLLPHAFFKSGIIDPVFNLFIFCGIYFLARAANSLMPNVFIESA
jgi:4-amino-4-deoxy-L-arabinose transferase-like glycosyltransferase